MRKACLGAALLLCCLRLLCLGASAQTYVDTMNTGGASSVRSADSNLTTVLRSRSLDPNDRYQLQLEPGSGGRLRGGVRYLVRGAESLSLRIYTLKGTYVSALSGQLVLGSDSGVFSPSPSAVSQAYYNTADGGLYAWLDGWQALEKAADGNYLQFRPAENVEQANLISFGVNCYYSVQGGAKSPLSLTRTAISSREVEGRILCAEDFVVSVPRDATSLWVELNDLGGGLLGSGGIHTSLAWVMIDGAALTMGEVREEPGEGVNSSLPESSAGASSQSSSGSSSRASSKTSSKASSQGGAAAAGGGGTSVPAAASSKFEGVITSSQASSKASKTSSSQEEAAQASAASQELPDYLGREPDPLIYTVEQPARKTGPDFGTMFYILLVVCVILYLLLRPKKE